MADRSNLPAPYESPLRQLVRALQAVLASLRLDLRSLWRRNRSGELARPAWWPADLAPLFWPLLLSAVVGGLVTAGVGLQRLVLRPEPAALTPVSGQSEQPSALPLSAPPEATSAVTAGEPAPPSLPEPVDRSPTAAPAEPEPDPLLQAMQGADSPALISSVSVHNDGAQLQLHLDATYSSLDPRRQQRLAETWLERSLALGFEQLDLVDPQGLPLGHRARVGSGMILLDPDAER